MEVKMIAAGILAIDKNSGKVLLVKRSPICLQPNLWANVGGRMDPEDKDTRHTAIREFKEEVQPDGPYRLSKLPFIVTNEGPVKFYTYLGIFENQFVPILNEENTEYDWFDLENLPEGLLPACDLIFRKRKKELKRIIRKMNQ